MPRMKSKSIISNSTKSTKVTFCDIVTEKFLYTYLAKMEMPTGIDTEKGSAIVSRMTPKLTAIHGLQKKEKPQGLVKHKHVS